MDDPLNWCSLLLAAASAPPAGPHVGTSFGLEEDLLWPPVWRCTAFVTNPVAEGRNGVPPGRAQRALPGGTDSHPSLAGYYGPMVCYVGV